MYYSQGFRNQLNDLMHDDDYFVAHNNVQTSIQH